MTEFSKGDLVTVTKTLVVEIQSPVTGCFTDGKGIVYHIEGECKLYPDTAHKLWAVEDVQHAIPSWPPQEGDMWKTSLNFYFFKNEEIYSFNTLNATVVKSCANVDLFKRWNPVIVYRKGGIK